MALFSYNGDASVKGEGMIFWRKESFCFT